MTTPSNIPAGAGRRMLAIVAALVTSLGSLVLAPGPASAAVPGAATRLLAIASPGSVRLAWFPPASDGGSDIIRYEITPSVGPGSTTTSSGPATLTGLANGTPVSFRVRAVNADGTGPLSAPSNTVTPRARTATNTWKGTGRMASARSGASAVRLGNGKVLVIAGDPGGFDAVPRRTAELYDPRTGSWSATGSLDAVRNGFTTTLLRTGKVLVAGGYTETFGVRSSTQLYDPATGVWSAGAPMISPRVGHTATRLGDGRVLVTGGVTSQVPPHVAASAEVYDPMTGRWSATGSMKVARFGHSATARRDGKVLIAGGTAGREGFRSAEVYSPATGTWVTTAKMTTVREFDEVCCKEAVRLRSGRVLVAGGYHNGVLRSAEIYDPATGAWTATGSMKVRREAGFSLLRLRNGKILAVGGLDNYGGLKYAELYDETTGRWKRTNDLKYERYAPAAVLLASGKVLVAGGGTNLVSRRSAELFTPA